MNIGGNKKNIAIIIPSLKIGGGAEKVAAQISNALSSLDYVVSILTFYSHDQEYPHSANRHSLNESLREFKILKLFRRAYYTKQFCKENDIAVAISFMPEANFPLILSKFMGNKVKVIASERNNPERKSMLYKLGIRMFYPFADHIVPVTRKIKYFLETNFNLKKITTIYNPINLEKSLHLQKEAVPNEYQSIFDSKNFVFVSIGRLIKQKNQISLIKSFGEIVEQAPHAKLIILGEGPLRNVLEDLIDSLHLEEHVFLLGNQTNIFPFLQASDCFVFTSLWEGFPNVLTEALSTDIPVITTDCDTGPREIIAPDLNVSEVIAYPYYGQYGILVDAQENTTEQLVTVMLRMIKEDDFRNKYCRGSDRLLTLNIQSIVRQWEDII